MRSMAFFAVGLLGICACGGSTSSVGNADASVDAPSDAPATVDGSGCMCSAGRTCCNGVCVNLSNDNLNCGQCGVQCSGATPYCDGSCKPAPCALDAGACTGGTCCGAHCCNAGDICCKAEGPIGSQDVCFTPTAQNPSCPQGCAPLCVSDRDAKRDLAPVEGREVLDRLARVPMSTWSYKSDAPGVRHLGPMAQDLHDAFGLGPTDKGYDPIDAHGLAFSSIQALYEMVKEQNARIDRLERENAKLRGACGRP